MNKKEINVTFYLFTGVNYLTKFNPEVCKKLIFVIKIYAKLEPPIAPTNQPEVNCLHPLAVCN
jgi:hypothetical protein